MSLPYQSSIAIVAFDMFGTLVRNDTTHWHVVFAEIAREQQLPLAGHALYREWHSREINFRSTRTDMRNPTNSPPFRTYEAAWGQAFIETFDALGLVGNAAAAANRCVNHLASQIAFPGVSLALNRLALHWPLAILSNADESFLFPVINNHRWAFDHVVSSESTQSYKPDPRIFAAFSRKVGVAPRRILYVGDSLYDDIHGAKMAGMQAAWLHRRGATPGRTPPPDGQKLRGPDLEVKSLLELERVLLSEGRRTVQHPKNVSKNRR